MRIADDSANLDFLRAYAVLAVYVGHILLTFHIERVLGPVTTYDLAQTGVLIFFVHTSLVLMLSLERLRLDGWRRFASFYIRRGFRIYPLSIATVLLMLIAHVPAFPTLPFFRMSQHALLADLTLTQNLTHSGSYPSVLWSLPFEVQMYLVLPVIFVAVQRFVSWWVPILLWIADVAALFLLQQLGVKGIPELLHYTPCFLGGVIAYRCCFMTHMKLRFWLWPVAITAGVLLRVLAEASSIPGATTMSPWPVCLFLGLAVPHFREMGAGWLRRAAGIIAKYSYGIYLSHATAFWIAFVVLRRTPFYVEGGACLALSALFPLAMYHGIEKPMIGLGVQAAARVSEKGGRR